MTLVLNEIHLLRGLSRTMVVAAADRRVTGLDGSYHSNQRKLFPIAHLRGAVSYFGLAGWTDRGKTRHMSDWLPQFISSQADASDLATFASNLREGLNRTVPSSVIGRAASGFQICGYRPEGWPEFWSLSNIGGMKDMQYCDLRPRYGDPVDDFLGRDARKLGWDGADPLSVTSGTVQYYRNGDYRMHIAAWELLDGILARLHSLPGADDFRVPSDPAGYEEYVRFKFEFIAYFYRRWARKKIIGKPIDVLVYTHP